MSAIKVRAFYLRSVCKDNVSFYSYKMLRLIPNAKLPYLSLYYIAVLEDKITVAPKSDIGTF